MPLKIMLNVRDTQTRSGRCSVPLSTAKPIYCNTGERSINPHTHARRHTPSPAVCFPGRRTQKAKAPCISLHPLQPHLPNTAAAHTGEPSCCLGQNTNGTHPETNRSVKRYGWCERIASNRWGWGRRRERDQVNTKSGLLTPTGG